MVEKRVIGNLDLVELNIGAAGVQAHGQGIADEMNFVPPVGQFLAEFRGHNAAATVGRITGNSDFHSIAPCCSGLKIPVRTTAFTVVDRSCFDPTAGSTPVYRIFHLGAHTVCNFR